jgi:putative SbcD/Mre11-related phosphoesterase
MKLFKKLELVNLGIKLDKTLILADFHIGYEEALNKQGVLIPRFQYSDIIAMLESTLGAERFDTIVINGDLKHEFGTISKTEWKQTLDLLDLLSEHCDKIVLIKGNHDTILEPIARKRNLEIVDDFVVGDIYICHGHKIPDSTAFKKSKIIIIGHEHPAITLRTDVRAEKYKCFLVGKYKDKKLVVMPSFNLVAEGTDLLKEQLLSPFLKQDIGSFEVFIVADTVYDFGKLRKLRKEEF